MAQGLPLKALCVGLLILLISDHSASVHKYNLH